MKLAPKKREKRIVPIARDRELRAAWREIAKVPAQHRRCSRNAERG
jgi:hypothetical protein